MIMEPIAILEPEYQEDTTCEGCQFQSTFLCNKTYKKLAWDGLFNRLDLVIEVYPSTTLDKIHNIELAHHRTGRYHVLVTSEHHCSYYAEECQCDKFRCDCEKIKARKVPFCLHLFNLKIPEEYIGKDYMFVIVDRKIEVPE